MKENILLDKSYKFALRIVKLCRFLNEEKHEYVMSKQVLHIGTSIGACVEAAQQGEHRADFLSKLSQANQFAFMSNYWLRLLRDSNYLSENQFKSMLDDCEELQKILITSIKTAKHNG